ncbi:MAG: FecR domain-containing protein [Polyangiaceae bacterium]
MRDPLNELGALAHQRASAEPTPELAAEGRQRIMVRAADLGAERARAWRRPAVLTAFAAAAAIAVFFGVFRSRPIGYIVLGSGEQTSDYLSAPADKPAEVRFTDGSELTAQPGTRLRVDQARNNGARVLIERGVATASVKHADRSNWQFVAGPFEVHVTGTKLTLGWDPLKEEVDLVLHEGSVEVESPLARGHFAVRAGQHFHASLLDGSMRVDNTNAGSSAAKQPEATPAVEASSSPEVLASKAKPEPALAPRAEAKLAPHSKLNSSPAVQSDAPRESWPELVRKGQFQVVVSAAENRGIESCLSSCTAADVRALADAARYSGKSSLAEQSLQSLRRRFSGSGEGSAAAFLLARLSESRRQLAAADGWYETYLREAPRGQFASDALAGRMRAVAALRGSAAAKPLALEYLRSYPDGVHAPAAKKLGGFD